MAIITDFLILNSVNNEVDSLRKKLCVHRKICMSDSEDVPLLAASSPALFNVIELTFRFEIAGAIGRLIDKTRQTASLRKALDSVEKKILVVRFRKLQSRVAKLEQDEIVGKLRDVRMRAVGHSSVEVAEKKQPPPSATLIEVEQVADKIALIINDICAALEVPNEYDESTLESSIERFHALIRAGEKARQGQALIN